MIIDIRDRELEELLVAASQVQGVDPDILASSLLREGANRILTNDKKNQGSVNPTSENTDSGVYTTPLYPLDISQANLSKQNSNNTEKHAQDPETENKKSVYVSYTYTLNTGDLSRVTDPKNGSEVWSARLPKTWSEAGRKICEEKKWSRSELARNALCIFIQAYYSSGVDLSEMEVKPRNTIILNYNSIQNNVSVGRPVARRYERELEEPRLKARLERLFEEIERGPPKHRVFDPKSFDYVERDPAPEDVAKWLSVKGEELAALLRKADKLKVVLTEGEEARLRAVRERLSSMGGHLG